MSATFSSRIFGGLLTALFLFLTAQMRAAEAGANWYTRSWQTDDGLPDNSVAGVAQTPDGYLWIGTPTGLARFDGLRFESLSLTNVIAPPNRGIITILRGAHGALWLAMDRGGLVYLHGKDSRAFTNGLSTSIPYNLAEDKEGACWISYRNGVVFRVKGNNVVPITDGLPKQNEICALTADKKGRVWFAKDGEVGIFRDGAFHVIFRLNAMAIRLAPANDGGVWICAGFHLYKCDDQIHLQDFGEFHPESSGTTATAMLEDHEGAVWIGTSFSGLFRRDASGFETISTSHQAILSLTEDSEGNIWVGTFGGGLDRIRRRAIRLEGPEEGLPFSSIQFICQDTNGIIWAVTQNGVLVRKINGRWNAIPTSNQWPGDATCVVADQQNSIWIGTHVHGVFCFRAGRFVNEDDIRRLEGKTIHTLLVGKKNDLWMGQENPPAVLHLRDGKLETFLAPGNSRIIRAMAQDSEGTIWAGTSKGVLLRIKNGKLDEVTPRSDEELASIRCLYATPDGALWIGFAGWGVGCIKNGSYAEINSGQGLFDDYISHIDAGQHGWLWFGANRGIFKVRLSDLENVAAGSASHVRSVHYGRGEGLPSLQATFGDSPDVLRSRDGQLWLPMQTALVVIDPNKLYESPNAPPTLITRVLVDDKTVARYGGILPIDSAGKKMIDLSASKIKLRVPPAHRRIEFEFAAFSFNAVENVEFRYRLKNFDDDWIDAGTRRSASYSRLPAGNYVFEMTACNSDGDWNKTASQLSIFVPPFFYQTWWFRSLVLLLFTASIIAIVRYVSFRRLHRRLRLLEQQAALQKERARIAKDIHDDLGADLTQIAFLGELARQDHDEKSAERITTISTTARQAIKSLDEIVWAVNPRNDTLAHLIDYAGQFALDYLRLAEIRCRLDLPEQSPPRELSTDLRHNLFLVVKEALHNIVKHARASEVWLRIHFSESALDISIEDNGCGFEREPGDALADGLRNMRQRMNDIGGEFRFESRSGAGTKIHLHLPWPKEVTSGR